MKSVSIVIPVFNESSNLNELIERTLKTCRSQTWKFEIILIDDGSRDNSAEIIQTHVKANPGEIIAVLLNRNYGQHSAIMAGFTYIKGDIVVTLDADLQNPPEEIPKLVNKINEGFDVVAGYRIIRSDSIFRKTFSYLNNQVTAKTTGVKLHDYGCMLRAYKKEIIEAMLQCQERSTYIPVLANTFAKNIVEIEVEHASRKQGDSKYNVWKLINLQFDLLTSMTTFPLRLLSVIGTVISFFGMSLGALIIVLRIIFGSTWAAEGVFTLFALLFVFIGFQFIGLGLLGEYIGRIYKDVRARPRYLIYKVDGESKITVKNREASSEN
ncbi:MAG: hypothetical protein ACD_79C00492G0002 [uncultured bacterium]|nr:MAG: hypothetical protein ACD_79C00492G0002 [uncultured bacterium]